MTVVDTAGLHAWYFPPSPDSPACTEAQSEERRLNLHRAVEQPGQFCCDDGACIDSELRCDNNNQCRDGSDERGCQVRYNQLLLLQSQAIVIRMLR